MEIVEPIKKHWPLVLGGVVGLFLVAKFVGARNASSTSSTATYSAGVPFNAQAYAAQSAASLQSAQLAQNTQIAEDTLNASTQVAAGKNFVNWTLAQGAVAQQIGTAAGNLIAALDMPTITAINNNAAADAQALKSAESIFTTGVKANALDIQNAGAAMGFVANTVSSSERSLAGAYIGAETAYGNAQAAASSAAASVSIAQANAAAAASAAKAKADSDAAIAAANASAKTQQTQAAAQSSSDSSMWSSVANVAATVLPFFLL